MVCANRVSPRNGTKIASNVITAAKINKLHFIDITFRQVGKDCKYSF